MAWKTGFSEDMFSMILWMVYTTIIHHRAREEIMKLLLLMVFAFGDTLHLTMDKAVEIALKNSPTLNSSREQARMGKLNFMESALSYGVVPTLSFNKIDTMPSTQNLGLKFTLFSVNGLNSVVNSFASARSSSYSLQQSRNSLILNVKTSYLMALSAQKSYMARVKQLKRAQENLRFVQAQYELGNASRLDLLGAKVQAGQAKLNVLKAETDYRNSISNLAVVLGFDPSRPISCDDIEMEIDTALPSPDSLVKLAMENRPDLRSLRASLGASKTSFWLKTFSFLPSVSYNLEWDRTDGQAWTKTGPKRYISLQFNILGYPFRVADGIGSVRKAEFEYRAAYLQAANEIISRYNDFKTAYSSYMLAKEVFEQAKAAYELAKVQHQAGQIGIIELFKAESDLADAESQLSSARYQLYIAKEKLDYSVGTIQ